MKYFKTAKVKLALAFLLIFIIVVSFIARSTVVNSKDSPVVKKGVIDLRNWDFNKDGMVKLDGQWEYYSNKLLSPQDFTSGDIAADTYSDLPGTYGNYGYGTYRLKILLSNHSDLYSIKVEFLQSAAKLWANDVQIIDLGKVGRDKNEMHPLLLPKSGAFYCGNGEVYITMQVSNYYSKYALVDTIVLGNTQMIENSDKKKLAFDLFLFGSTFIAAIYNFGLFLRRRKDKSPLYFAIVCIIVAIRTLFLGQRFFISMFPGFSYITAMKIMHWTFYLYIPFIVLYIDSFYKGIVNKRIFAAAIYSAYIYGFMVLISPIRNLMDIILPFEIITYFFLLYLMYKVCKIYLLKGKSDFVMAIAIFSLFLTRLNDILYEYSIIITGSFAALGTLVFIIANAYLLAERQSAAFSNIEEMSEKLESINKQKDDFLAIVAHELKTPLNGIIGLSESLSDSTYFRVDEDINENISLINASAKRLSNLVNDIMVFSRLKNQDIKLHLKPVNINKISEMVVKFCSTILSNRKVSIVNLIDNKAPYVYGDEERVQQIFFNLVGNAMKFTSQGHVTLSYTCNENFVNISVEDTGIGIPKNKLHEIFNIYEQADGISDKYGGTGLGLYISRKLIELHGGNIEVQSEPGRGTKFTFKLPLSSEQIFNDFRGELGDVETGNTVSEEWLLKDNFAVSTLGKCKILIADDEYINQRVLGKYLSGDEVTILRANNGEEAIRLVTEINDIDLVILDMMMPDLLGYEVCNLIRERYSIFELPILIMTADSRLENMVVSFECGANDYLVKPFNKYELLSRVSTLINLRRSVQDALELTKQVAAANEKVESLNYINEASSKKVRELIEYDKLKTEFFTNMSHELRTPLNVICSTIQLLESLDKAKVLGDEKIKYYFNIMSQNSLRLLRLVNNIIDLTKLDGGFMGLNLANDNIVYVVEEITQSVAEYVKTQDITIVFDTEIEEKIIAFDSEKMERIILNILSNAVKFTDKNGCIYVNIYDKNDTVEISIRDTGIGIPADKLDFIFERFAQVDRSLTRKNEGSGIGLSLVKSLVEAHGGKIIARSQIKKGTEFIISLPVKVVDSETSEMSIINKAVPEAKYEKSLSVEFSDIYLT
jgi:two-component system sensor histidine kinase ChiS